MHVWLQQARFRVSNDIRCKQKYTYMAMEDKTCSKWCVYRGLWNRANLTFQLYFLQPSSTFVYTSRPRRPFVRLHARVRFFSLWTGLYDGKKRHIVRYDCEPWAQQKRLNRSRCRLDVDLGGSKEASVRRGCICAILRIRLNRPFAAAIRLWPRVACLNLHNPVRFEYDDDDVSLKVKSSSELAPNMFGASSELVQSWLLTCSELVRS